jgi:hypothetical protein
MNPGTRTAPRIAFGGRATGVLSAAALLLSSNAVAAQSSDVASSPAPDRAACLTAHTNAQELKRGGKLLEAEGELKICASAGCPGAIISDCGQWIADLEQTTPSLIFEVRVDGKQFTDFEVQVDGSSVTDHTKAHRVNPGRHVVRVQVPNFEPKEETVALPEGQRMRLVAFNFDSPTVDQPQAPVALPPPQAPLMDRPTPVLVYPLLGVGVAGLASVGVFTSLGKSKESELEDECAPACSDADLEPMKRHYLIGDISAGVGAASLIAAGVVYLARPSRPAVDVVSSIRLGPARAGDWHSLALSVQRTW